MLICDNKPQEYCKDDRDISLCLLEELPGERELHEMDQYCPGYIVIGCGGGGGEVLLMRLILCMNKLSEKLLEKKIEIERNDEL